MARIVCSNPFFYRRTDADQRTGLDVKATFDLHKPRLCFVKRDFFPTGMAVGSTDPANEHKGEKLNQ